jgi:hypothetical protein
MMARVSREGLIDQENTASDVWADTAYRSKANEEYLSAIGKVSRIHCKKPKGKPMARHIAKANAQIAGALQGRTRLRRAQAPDGTVHPDHRSGSGHG